MPVQNQVSGKRISTRTEFAPLLTAAFGDRNDTCMASASVAATTVPRGRLARFHRRHARRRAGVACQPEEARPERYRVISYGV
jgi:hypothetical protein